MNGIYEGNTGLGVFNHYGPRGTQDGVVGGGKLPVHGNIDEMVVYVNSADFGTDETFDTQFTLPSGAIPVSAIFEVTEDFTQTGGTTSLTLNVGTSGSEGTNGYSISDAATTLSAVTELDSAAAGTWASALAADTLVGVSLVAGGGTITAVTGGEAKVVVRYYKV